MQPRIKARALPQRRQGVGNLTRLPALDFRPGLGLELGVPELAQAFAPLSSSRAMMSCCTSVERLYREIRALRIYEGATEVQQLIIARELLKGAKA